MDRGKTGVQLNIQWVPDGSYDEKVFASLATGTLPQALYLKNAASLSYFRDEIRSGLFWEIGPYLEDYPNLQRLKPEVLKNTAIDGKLYSLYQERALARSGIITARTGQIGWGYRHRKHLMIYMKC